MSSSRFNTVIVSTNAGIPYFEFRTSESQLDSVLIGGYSTALSTVWSNFVESDEPGFEIIERSKDKICFIVHRTKTSTLLLISKARPSKFILDKIARIHNEIEREFPEIIDLNNKGGYKKLPDEPILQIFKNYNLGMTNSTN